ncbi:MAG: helix-hairpin-helix domain-containing protein, partial [Pseudomonadota bacterium]
EESAITVFRDNLKNLLMASPAGKKNTLGLDPGIRTGVKVVVVDDTGKLLTHTVIFPHAPQNDWSGSMKKLAALCSTFKVDLVSIGNGTGSRETEKLVKEIIKTHPDLQLTPVIVSEAGASVYSASELAAHEFPDLDVSYRGAVSIARRLQDPLAELVKIDPKAIGVGQYQHDVNALKLTRGLNAVLEDCVNAVGVDINTASVPLLKSIAGLNESVAKNIVKYREDNGRFKNRDSIKNVPRLGEKAFQQAIGFLRIVDGENPLDASSVHPESYFIVEKILQKTNLPLQELIGNIKILNSLKAADFITQEAGEMTVGDIFSELKKPGRDPRPEFVSVKFQEGVETLSDLKVGMLLEGMVTNVANFGAFVDIGVHQDGLVHISQLANSFVSDPNTVVKVGQIVKVKVLEVDIQRKRIQLTMKMEGSPQNDKIMAKKTTIQPQQKRIEGGFADLLQNALKR